MRAALLLPIALALATPLASAQEDTPPLDGRALAKWLQAGRYKAWPKESAPHRSMGSHQTLVLTHLNPALDRSLAAKAAEHPKGAAAVKELLDTGGKVIGWAVAVKTAADGAKGKGWYWFEVANGTVGGQGEGVALCVACHARGRDSVLTEHPLD